MPKYRISVTIKGRKAVLITAEDGTTAATAYKATADYRYRRDFCD